MQLTDVKAQSVKKQGHASGTCGTRELRNMSISIAVRIVMIVKVLTFTKF